MFRNRQKPHFWWVAAVFAIVIVLAGVFTLGGGAALLYSQNKYIEIATQADRREDSHKADIKQLEEKCKADVAQARLEERTASSNKIEESEKGRQALAESVTRLEQSNEKLTDSVANLSRESAQRAKAGAQLAKSVQSSGKKIDELKVQVDNTAASVVPAKPTTDLNKKIEDVNRKLK